MLIVKTVVFCIIAICMLVCMLYGCMYIYIDGTKIFDKVRNKKAKTTDSENKK